MFSADFKETPFWWERTPRPQTAAGPLPRRADVVVVGSGYTGLGAALQTARAGRETLVLEAEAIGWGCSARNGGLVGYSIKPEIDDLASRYGPQRARGIRQTGAAALDWFKQLVADENIDCNLYIKGEFCGAHTAGHFDRLAQRLSTPDGPGAAGAELVSREHQREYIGTDAYHGGVVYHGEGVIDPARYHAGLLKRAEEARARVIGSCAVTAIKPGDGGFEVETVRGTVMARDVLVATNGYSGRLWPWLSRRLIPIASTIIATEPLPAGLMDMLMPDHHAYTDTRKVVYYYRPCPERKRIIFGGRVSAGEVPLKEAARRLHRDMCALFPELHDIAVSHCWMGHVAYTFHTLPHIGQHDGVWFAGGYCGSGISMSSYLGMKAGRKIAELDDNATAFDDLCFPTRPFYNGNPWFMPAAVAWYKMKDRLGL